MSPLSVEPLEAAGDSMVGDFSKIAEATLGVESHSRISIREGQGFRGVQ